MSFQLLCFLQFLSALKVPGIHCGVTEKHVSTPKNKRILAAIEPL